MHKPRLLFSISYYSPYISGLTLYVRRLSEALQKQSFDCSVLCMNHAHLPAEDNVEGIRVIRCKPVVAISKGFISFEWLWKSWYEVRKSDVVFINLPQFEGMVVAWWCFILHKQLISIYHCDVYLPVSMKNWIIQKLLDISHSITLMLSSTVVTYTDDFAQNSRLLPKYLKKVQTIYPIFNRPRVNKRVQNKIQEKIRQDKRFIIGIAARLAAEKGIEYVIESIPIIKASLRKKSQSISYQSILLVIAGSMNPVGEDAYKQRIMKLVKAYQDDVVFLGEIDANEMGSFYSCINLLALPSVNSTEAFGMVQVEAMLCGVPVIATDLPGVRVPVQETGMGIIVPPASPQAIAEAVLAIMQDRDKFQKSRLDLDQIFAIDKTVQFYSRLISSSYRGL